MMLSGQVDDEATAASPRPAGGERSDGRRWITWQTVLVVVVLLVAGTYAVRRFSPDFVDDGFIAFEPDASLFPNAPVDGAKTIIGTGRPASWYSGPEDCEYALPAESAFGNDWNTVRHDWVEDGADKAWIISERTVGFTDRTEFDDYVDDFHDRIRYCGYEYEGYSSELKDVDGLPGGAFVFYSRASQDPADQRRFVDSSPGKFDSLTAVLPGRKRGQVMFVTWVGWGANVPTDEFVATVNRLYDAAHDSKKPSRVDDDTTIDFQFVDYEPTPSVASGDLLVVDVVDPRLRSERCNRESVMDDLRALTEEDHASNASVYNEQRLVLFMVARWRERSGYLEAKQEMARILLPRCIDSMQPPAMLIEPIEIPGLPDGAVASVWHDSVGEYVVLVSDDARQLAMVVAWEERDGTVPTEMFVDAVNKAWDKVLAQNP